VSDELIRSLTAILTAIVGLAVLAVIVSNQANTTNVIQASASGFSNALATAEAPVTGASANPVLSYPAGASNMFSGLSSLSLAPNATIGE
jgi:PRD1 phage membrane DNA delivery